MSEKEVLRAFNDYDQPVSDFVLHRVQCITMRVLKTKSVPPMTLIRKIRATGNYIIPWDHSAWQLWEESVKPTDRHQKVESSKREKVDTSKSTLRGTRKSTRRSAGKSTRQSATKNTKLTPRLSLHQRLPVSQTKTVLSLIDL
jgi:hypothetical protein